MNEGLKEKIRDTELLRCWGIHAIPHVMEDSEMITTDNAVPPLTRNVFDYLVANLILRKWYTSPSNSIFIFHRGLIILEEFLLGYLANGFFIFTPRQPNRKGSDPTDEFWGYYNGEASNGDSGMCSCVRD